MAYTLTTNKTWTQIEGDIRDLKEQNEALRAVVERIAHWPCTTRARSGGWGYSVADAVGMQRVADAALLTAPQQAES